MWYDRMPGITMATDFPHEIKAKWTLSDHLVQHRQTGEQMTHYLCLTCPSASYALQFGNFVPVDRSAAKGPFQPLHQSIKMASKRAFVEKKTCKKN